MKKPTQPENTAAPITSLNLWDAARVCAELGCSERTLDKLCIQRSIRHAIIAGKRKFKPQDVAQYVESLMVGGARRIQ